MTNTSRPKYCKEAPDWFDLGKYEAVRELDAKGWLYQLSSRLTLDVLWQPPPDDIADQLDDSEDNEWTQTAYEIRRGIKNEGVLKPPYNLADRIADPYDDFFGKASFGYSAVRSLTNSDVYNNLWHPHCRNEILKKINSLNNPTSFERSTQEWADQAFKGDHHSSTFVGIDLNVSDDQLVDDFKKWLGSARKRLAYPERKRNFTENVFLMWRRFKVLPYIDLQMWALKFGFKYSQDTLADFLFDPRDMIGKETVRKTTRKHANAFWKAYPALRAQVEGALTTQLT